MPVPWPSALPCRSKIRIAEFTGPVLSELLSDPARLIASNDENAIFQWYPGLDQWNPLYDFFIYNPRDRRVNISELLFLYLDPYNDPRLSVYAETAASDGAYSGRPITKSSLPPGTVLNPNPHGGRQDNDYSRPGDMWFAEDGYFSLLQYPEVCFLRAEAAYLGLSGETAKNLYYEGIDASLQMFGKETKATAYKAENGITWGTYGAGVANDWLANLLSPI